MLYPVELWTLWFQITFLEWFELFWVIGLKVIGLPGWATDERRGLPESGERCLVLFMGDLIGTGINYLRRRSRSGIYYWQAKIGGVSRKGSLKTTSKATARDRLPAFLARARAKFEGGDVESVPGDECETVKDWLELWKREQEERVRLKERTKRDAAALVRVLNSAPWAGVEIGKVSVEDMRKWWRAQCRKFEPVTVNGRLRVLRAVWKLAVDRGAVSENVPEKLERMPVRKKLLQVPTNEELEAIVKSVRMQQKRVSGEVATMIEFFAYSGLRPGEVKALKREHIKGDVIEVRGGSEGTKNRREREVPVVPVMRKLIDEKGLAKGSGPVFFVSSPYRALVAACARLGLPQFNVYRLRHYFATVCVESGVDVPTIALWMGHGDGGKLLMETYQHVRREHSKEQASKVRFA